MEKLPEELIAKIFSYLTDSTSAIVASQVCSYFKLVATTQIRAMKLKLASEKVDEIRFVQEALGEFQALKKLKLEISFDVNSVDKSRFCHRFREKLTHLTLRDMTFLNPFFDHCQPFSITSLTIQNSDLTSCSNQVSQFIVRFCPKLTHLTISGCSGLEIESLNYIGQNLNETTIENFQFLPTYSYFDVSQTPSADHQWTIEKLKTLSIRSTIVVMRKNFVRNLIGRRSENLTTLELIAELDLGDHLATKIIQNFPNLQKLSLGKGCAVMRNEDFLNLCNFYKNLKSLEFHFSQSDSVLDLKGLRRNESMEELTVGLTKNISLTDVKSIAKQLPNVTRLNIVLYFLSTSNQKFLTFLTKTFPNVKHIQFQRTGMSENMKFTAIKDEIDSHLKHFDEIKNLAN